MKHILPILLLLSGILYHACQLQDKSGNQLPRIIVLTDINNVGGDPDDKQSMAHLFMYANEVDIKAIVPDYWNGKGYEATMQAVDAYEQDFLDPEYAFHELGYPHPDSLKKLIARNDSDAISRIIKEAKRMDARPLYILVWGGMGTIQRALFEAPEITGKIRVLTIATNLMADNPDSRKNARVDQYCKTANWNGRQRDDIFYDQRFDSLWWIENDWAYNGMFEGESPGKFLLEIKTYGQLGYYMWDVVQSKSWAHYFRAGDTPTLLYLLEDINHDDPAQFTWGGRFIRPFPESRPHYWIDDAGIEEWNYEDPCETWELAQKVYQNRIQGLMDSRESMYNAYREKMVRLYRKQNN
jgi:hypothetical protein